MNINKYRLLVIFVLSLIGGTFLSPNARAEASEISAQQLYDRCRPLLLDPSSTSPGVTFCLGYMAGFIHGIQVLEVATHTTWLCLPEAATSSESARLFLRYIERHPEEVGESARLELLRALLPVLFCPRTPA